MMKVGFLKSLFLTSLFLLVAAPVLALGKPEKVSTRPNISTQDGVMRSCQARESAIRTRLTHLTDLVSNMETKFEAIAKRVEDYYTSKVVPNGKTLSNYDSLVADIQTKKTVVQTALTKAQNETQSFSCESGTPKAQLTQFRNDMQAVKSALKDYRTSIKNLIVTVHSVTGTENRESPKPTK